MVAMLSTAGDLSHASRCKLLSEACELLTGVATMLEQREAVADDPVAWMSPGKETLEFSRPDTVYGSHTIPLYASRHARQVPDGLDESSCVPVNRPNIYAAGWTDYRGCMLSAAPPAPSQAAE